MDCKFQFIPTSFSSCSVCPVSSSCLCFAGTLGFPVLRGEQRNSPRAVHHHPGLSSQREGKIAHLVSILECTHFERETDKERDRDRERVPVVLRVLARIHREHSSSGTFCFCSSQYFIITPEDSGLKPGNRRRASPTHLSWARGFDAKPSALVAPC